MIHRQKKTQTTKNRQSSKTLCKNDRGIAVNKSEVEMAGGEEKSTGDIITLIFKGQKSMKMFVLHLRDKKTVKYKTVFPLVS